MNKLHIDNLRFWGTHGEETAESRVRKLFNTAISVEYDFDTAIKTDHLTDTLDYKKVELIVKEIIEGKPVVLIERLADTIATCILDTTTAYSVEVVLSKPYVDSYGVPSITLRKIRNEVRTSQLSNILHITKEMVDHFYDPTTDGILHLKNVLYQILDQEKVTEWYIQKSATFEKKDEKYIENNQEVSVVYNGPFRSMGVFDSPQEIALHTIYHRIRDEIEKHSGVPLKRGDRLETKLIKYPISELGVGAHKDLSSNINCIAVMNLYGTTRFYTALDKKKNRRKRISC